MVSSSRWPPLLLLAAATGAAVASASSGSASGSASGSGSAHASAFAYAPSWCRAQPFTDVMAAQNVSLTLLKQYCYEHVCPKSAEADFRNSCQAGIYHGFKHTFEEATTNRPGLNWTILFLVTCALSGAMFRMAFPFWLPYTVGLLVVGFIFGVIAQVLSSQNDCPMYALLASDANHDSVITRAEWDNFICVDCVANSMCLVDPKAIGSTNPASCGDGTQYPSGCRWTFEGLNQPWSRSAWLPERNKNTRRLSDDPLAGAELDPAGFDPISGRRVDGGRGLSAAIDHANVLTGDELWTASCNMLTDWIGLSNIDPHTMLIVFLPALLFESACFGLDIGIFRKQIAQILIMAFPAMIVASVLTALMLWALAPASWTFWVCWLIGIISSATDPVAVVALLKDLGASKSLGTLIEGESLLNDGSAVVLFIWVKNAIGYDFATLAPGWMTYKDGARYTGEVGTELARIIAQMLVFGIVFGLVAGAFTRYSLKFVYNDKFVETCLIVGMSYLVFWLGELVMGTSAVLAVVVMGLYMNKHKSAISPGVLHFLHEFYEMVANVLNTVIFLIAGCKLGTLVADASFYDLFTNWRTLAMIILMYPIILIARGLAITLFFPIVRRLGTKATWKDAVIMWWGGLRGSVGLALGLAVHHTVYDSNMWGTGSSTYTHGKNGELKTSLDCRDQPMMVLYLTVLVVSGTVIINGVTMAPLMKKLKMTDTPDERKYMLIQAYKKIERETHAHIADLKHGSHQAITKDVDWGEVDAVKLTCLSQHEGQACDNPDKAAWLQVLNLERAFYLAAFEGGKLGSEAFATMEAFMANLLAEAHMGQKYKTPDQLSELYDRRFYEILISRIEHHALSGHALVVSYEVGLIYLACQREIDHIMEGGGHGHGGHGGHGRASGRASHGDHSEEEENTRRRFTVQLEEQKVMWSKVRKEHEDNVDAMVKALEKIQAKAPQLIARFKTRHMTTLMLYKQKELIDHMQHEGELTDLDAGPLRADIELKLRDIYVAPIIGGMKRRLHIKHDSKSLEAAENSHAQSVERTTPKRGSLLSKKKPTTAKVGIDDSPPATPA